MRLGAMRELYKAIAQALNVPVQSASKVLQFAVFDFITEKFTLAASNDAPASEMLKTLSRSTQLLVYVYPKGEGPLEKTYRPVFVLNRYLNAPLAQQVTCVL